MATWKKVIVSGSSADLLNVSASAGFKGNLVGDVTGTATQVGNSLTVDDSTIQLNSGTTYDGAAARTISIKDSGVTLAKQADLAADRIQGRANGAGTGAPQALTAAQVRTIINVEDGADVTDAAGIAALGAGIVSGSAQIASDISGSLSATAIAELGASIVSSSAQVDISGKTIAASQVTEISNLTAAEGAQLENIDSVTISNAQWGYLGGQDQSVASTDSPTFNNLRVSGDLTVEGSRTELQVANLNVEDQYILLNSGSTSGDSGIIFGGSNTTANSGHALILDNSYNSNDGRLAVQVTDKAASNSDDFAAGTTGYYLAGVYEGSEANAATALADHPGNIRIENSEIYIYV